MILVFVSHLFLDVLLLFNLVNIPVLPATFAQLNGPRADVFSVEFFDRASEVLRVFKTDKTIPGRQISQTHSIPFTFLPFRLIAPLVPDDPGFLETREA